jgi:hypothetical protein
MRFPVLDSSGKSRLTFFDRLCIKLFKRILEFPFIEFLWKIPAIIKEEGERTDLLISIAYPHPIHWGCSLAKKEYPQKFPKCWISDCGDPYMGNQALKPMRYFQHFEKQWGRRTDYITIPINEARDGYSKDVQDKIRIIPQGFDFEATPLCEYEKNNA